METANNILIPIDFSEQSIIAMEQGIKVAKTYRTEVTLLYVIETSNNFFSSLFSEEQSIKAEQIITDKLKELASKTEQSTGLKVHYYLTKGKVYEKIVEVAEMFQSDFIVMGTSSGGESIKSRFIGTTTLRVVRESHIPVITIKGKTHRDGCKTIILPLDLTKETREKVTSAIDFARKFGSEIKVVCVFLTDDDAVITKLTRQLNQVVDYINERNIKAEGEAINAFSQGKSFAEVILEYAEKQQGDLIMIMTQQEQDFVERFIGSSAQEIINKSPIPVLSIIPKPKKDTSAFTPY